MIAENEEELIDELDEILETEQRAVFGGDVDVLVALLERKERLIQGLGAVQPGSPEYLDRLHAKVVRNQRLRREMLRLRGVSPLSAPSKG